MNNNKTIIVAVMILAVTCLCLAASDTPAQDSPGKSAAEDCTVRILKVSELGKVKVSRWGSQAGTPFGGIWRTNQESPPQAGQVWMLVSGKLVCPGSRSGLPLPTIAFVNESSTPFFAVGFAGLTEPTEDADFTALEGSPGTGRMAADGPVWFVLPAKETGIMTLYLAESRFKSGPPDVDISLLFAVPKSGKDFNLQIRGKQIGKVPRMKRSGS